MKTSTVPFSQSLPWYPLRLKHSKLPGLLKQLPPFLQGILLHSLTSQRKYSNKKIINIFFELSYFNWCLKEQLRGFRLSLEDSVCYNSCQLKTPYVKSVCFDLCKCHNGTSIRMSWGTAILPVPTDRSWVSEDADLMVSRQTFVINTQSRTNTTTLI